MSEQLSLEICNREQVKLREQGDETGPAPFPSLYTSSTTTFSFSSLPTPTTHQLRSHTHLANPPSSLREWQPLSAEVGSKPPQRARPRHNAQTPPASNPERCLHSSSHHPTRVAPSIPPPPPPPNTSAAQKPHRGFPFPPQKPKEAQSPHGSPSHLVSAPRPRPRLTAAAVRQGEHRLGRLSAETLLVCVLTCPPSGLGAGGRTGELRRTGRRWWAFPPRVAGLAGEVDRLEGSGLLL